MLMSKKQFIVLIICAAIWAVPASIVHMPFIATAIAGALTAIAITLTVK